MKEVAVTKFEDVASYHHLQSSSQSLSPSSSQPAYESPSSRPRLFQDFSAALGPSLSLGPWWFFWRILLVIKIRLTYGQLVREVSEGTIYDGNSTIVKAGFHIPPP